jgi:hypothetical protein
MSYTFTIGNAVPEFSKDDGDLSARWVVEGKTLPEAPEFPHDTMTGQSNRRSPSYSGWHEFCKAAGVYDVFYDERGNLQAGHPGCAMLTESDYERVKVALAAWRTHATKPPGFSGWNNEDEGKYDHVLARLIWLEFWMRWALDNCETPAIQNT